MPGKMHSFPSSRTTGYVLCYYFYWKDVDWRAYHPNVLLYEDYFSMFGEEGHATGGGELLGVLGSYPLAVFVHL